MACCAALILSCTRRRCRCRQDERDRIDEGQPVNDSSALVFNIDVVVELHKTAERVRAKDGTRLHERCRCKRASTDKLSPFRVEKNVVTVTKVKIVECQRCPTSVGAGARLSLSLRGPVTCSAMKAAYSNVPGCSK